MLRQDDALYDADTLLDLQQSKHAIQVPHSLHNH